MNSHIRNNLKPHSIPFYKNFINCDFCGASTRGEVFLNSDDQPEGGIYCNACHALLVEDHTASIEQKGKVTYTER